MIKEQVCGGIQVFGFLPSFVTEISLMMLQVPCCTSALSYWPYSSSHLQGQAVDAHGLLSWTAGRHISGQLNGCSAVTENSASGGSQSALQVTSHDLKVCFKQEAFFPLQKSMMNK